MAGRGRDSKHNGVATTAELTTANGQRGDILTADDGGVGIVGEGVVALVGSSTPERAYQVRAVISSILSPVFTLSGGNNTLTAGANAALGAYLGLGYTMPVGSAAFVLVGGVADGLWTVTTEGDGATPAVLTRSTSYRTAVALPELVAYVSPLLVNGEAPVYALVGTPPTPGAGALPYYRVDQVAFNDANNISPDQIASASTIGATQARVPQCFPIDVSSATQDTPLVLPYACTLVMFTGVVSTAVGGSSATLRTETGGGGSAWATISTAGMGGVLEGVTSPLTTPRALAAGTYYLRRVDTGVRGTFYAWVIRS